MHETERRWRAMINPWSSAFTRWWCHSTARYILTGYGRGSGQVAKNPGRAQIRWKVPGAVMGLLAGVALAESQDRERSLQCQRPEGVENTDRALGERLGVLVHVALTRR
jgi:hypothetical protein